MDIPRRWTNHHTPPAWLQLLVQGGHTTPMWPIESSLVFFKLESRGRCLLSWVAVLEGWGMEAISWEKPVCSRRKYCTHERGSSLTMGPARFQALVLVSGGLLLPRCPPLKTWIQRQVPSVLRAALINRPSESFPFPFYFLFSKFM